MPERKCVRCGKKESKIGGSNFRSSLLPNHFVCLVDCRMRDEEPEIVTKAHKMLKKITLAYTEPKKPARALEVLKQRIFTFCDEIIQDYEESLWERQQPGASNGLW